MNKIVSLASIYVTTVPKEDQTARGTNPKTGLRLLWMRLLWILVLVLDNLFCLLGVLGQRNVLHGLVVLDAGFFLDVVASLGDTPHGNVPRGGVVVVESLGFQKGTNGMCRLEGVVVGHLVE